MTKQYDTQEQIDAFNIYVKQTPAGRQVHHTGTLGYDDDEWKAFQEGWNAALAKPSYRAVKAYHEGKPVYVSQSEQEPVERMRFHSDMSVSFYPPLRTFDDYGNKIV